MEWVFAEGSWPAWIVDDRFRVIVSAVLVDDGWRTWAAGGPFGSKSEGEDEDGTDNAGAFPTSLKLLFDLNGLVFFAAPVVGGCKGLPVSFWTGVERSTSGCRPRAAWSSAPTELALEVRGCAYCGMLEKLELVGTLRADKAGEAERAPDIAEPGLRGGRRVDRGISSSLLSDDSFSLVSVSAIASFGLVCVGGTNDPRERDDGRLIPGTLVLRIGAREPKQKGSQYLSSYWIVGPLTTMPQLTPARTGPLLLLTYSRRVPMPQLRFCFPAGTGTT